MLVTVKFGYFKAKDASEAGLFCQLGFFLLLLTVESWPCDFSCSVPICYSARRVAAEDLTHSSVPKSLDLTMRPALDEMSISMLAVPYTVILIPWTIAFLFKTAHGLPPQ
jgi:hypothetical protein